MSEVILAEQLQALRLSKMGANWRDLEVRSLAESWTPARFLSQLCELELEHRRQQRYQRHLKESRLPPGKTMATLQLEVLRGVNGAVITHLSEQQDWIERGDNLLLFGASGLGKTHIAAAIGQELIASGVRGRFYGATELVQHAKQELKLNELLLKLDRYRFIVVDDIGYVSRDLQETSVLFELIAHRYERASLIITANQPFSQWGNIFADSSMTVAAVDRLIHHGNIIELEGESYRRKTAQQRSATEKSAATTS